MKSIPSKESLVLAIKVMARAISGLTDEQYEGLIEGKGKLVYSSSIPPATKRATDPNVDLDDLLDSLGQSAGREEALQLFAAANLAKPQLLSIADSVGVHTTKQDTKTSLAEKIVESVVGSRLRSEAIREVRLNRS